MLNQLKKDLQKLANPQKVKVLQKFFKTGKGEYGEGDIFIGVPVPQQRKIAKKYQDLSLADLQKLLTSKIHEQRLTALFILINKFKKADYKRQKQIFNLYMKNYQYCNNWDLVDSSAPYIAGLYLLNKLKQRKILYTWARSRHLWKKRIAIIATFTFIREHDYEDTLKLAEILLHDNHDLIQKAVGWMLREVGNRDLKTEEKFLKKYYQSMPRTMLRYAIEKFPQSKRQFYLRNKKSK